MNQIRIAAVALVVSAILGFSAFAAQDYNSSRSNNIKGGVADLTDELEVLVRGASSDAIRIGQGLIARELGADAEANLHLKVSVSVEVCRVDPKCEENGGSVAECAICHL